MPALPFTSTPTLPTAQPSPSLPMPTAAATPTIHPTPAPQEWTPPARYDLKVIFDYQAHSLKVEETITFTHSAGGDDLDELLLVVEPNRKPGRFKLERLTWQNGSPVKNYNLDGARLAIPLQPALNPGGELGLALAYVINLPERSGAFGYTLDQANASDWYPFIPAYSPGSGWLVHEPAAVGEHLVYDIARFKVEIDLQNAPPGLLLAASAPLQVSGSTYRAEVETARNFSFSASEGYIHITDASGPVPVEAYVSAGHLEPGMLAAQYSAAALALFSELFTPYDRPSLTIVEWKHPDGIELDGMFFLNWNYFEYAPGGAASGLATLMVHETAHQWWYASVGNDPALEPWLDEALCTYSEKIYYDHLHPGLVDWWWDYRVLQYNPAGSVNSTIYDLPTERSYVNAVYLRGALFMDQLHAAMGDGPFMAFLKEYAAQNQDHLASSGDFFNLLSGSGSEDLSPVMDQFFTAQK